ncbi:hypothetical protein FACS189442_1590 [Spirochaetia bacterium]|nr:hypothetical protein FACS189442_1590 [Spirochaetia bacterium]
MNYSISDNHLNKNQKQDQGSYFTPEELAKIMARQLFPEKPNIKKLKILDPCVGRANLFKAIKELYSDIPNKCFYGIDVDVEAINLNKQDPELKGMNFKVGNCLTDDINSDDFWKNDRKIRPAKQKRKVVPFKCVETGKEYNCYAVVEEEMGIPRESVRQSVKLGRKSKGYHFVLI